ncbi:MAG TPA: ROK family protein [Trueperaceae bacterium]|nr:ROK family protein [Trueperaceae bacterium]
MRTLGLDLGGTKIAAAVVEDGRILDAHRVETPQTGFEDVAEALAGAARTLLERGHGDVLAVGIGSPGPLDYEHGKVLFAPNIAGMEDAPIVEALQKRLQQRIVLENDANAAGLAEHLYGAARELQSSLYLTISTGIGGGLFIGDRVIRGAHGLAGEVGHMTVLPGGPIGGDGLLGSLEAIAAGRSIARDASYGYGRDMETREVFERAESGEAKALAIVENAARFTGIGIANLQKIFDPEGFVIGGGMTAAGEFYISRIRKAAAEYLRGYPDADIRLAQLGTDAGVIGAAAVAAQSVR